MLLAMASRYKFETHKTTEKEQQTKKSTHTRDRLLRYAGKHANE